MIFLAELAFKSDRLLEYHKKCKLQIKTIHFPKISTSGQLPRKRPGMDRIGATGLPMVITVWVVGRFRPVHMEEATAPGNNPGNCEHTANPSQIIAEHRQNLFT